jgi:glycerate kinase
MIFKIDHCQIFHDLTLFMPLNILIVPDKFKGTLTAQAAAKIIARGWRKARPDDRLELVPMCDGGDGFGEIVGALIKAKARTARTVNAAHEACVAPWWWDSATDTAILEAARTIGLAMLPPARFHPFQLDTRGLGLLLSKVANRGVKRCVVGLGGSATNDGGFGMARALGWEFLDREKNQIEDWTRLYSLMSLRAPQPAVGFRQLVIALDVRNPLLGPKGATRTYGPQKGLRPPDIPVAERCLRRLALVVRDALGQDFARLPGAGAAGGLGFAFMAFLGARIETGFEIFARYAKLQQRLNSADLVLTGEGAIDASTLMGKGVGQVARLCRRKGVPCFGLAGVVNAAGKEQQLFDRVLTLTQLTSLTEAKTRPAFWLECLAERAAKEYKVTH